MWLQLERWRSNQWFTWINQAYNVIHQSLEIVKFSDNLIFSTLFNILNFCWWKFLPRFHQDVQNWSLEPCFQVRSLEITNAFSTGLRPWTVQSVSLSHRCNCLLRCTISVKYKSMDYPVIQETSDFALSSGDPGLCLPYYFKANERLQILQGYCHCKDIIQKCRDRFPISWLYFNPNHSISKASIQWKTSILGNIGLSNWITQCYETAVCK